MRREGFNRPNGQGVRMKVLASNVQASVPRMVNVYCPSLWDGPQPGVVVGGPFKEPVCENAPEGLRTVEDQAQCINVNALVDGANFPKALARWRSVTSGNTLTSVPLYDALTTEQRAEVAGRGWANPSGLVCWCEWPPRA
jgi:hypothetical protein